MIDMIETATYRSVPRKISQLTSFVTPEPDLFVLAHLGIPSLPREDWSLTVTGMTATPLVDSFMTSLVSRTIGSRPSTNAPAIR